jgi:predicted RNA-binding Zn-ribbon protein involved in translation (DUF1610 family)
MSVESMHRCLKCGFEAPTGGKEWKTVDHSPLGELTQCPECGSTNTRTM